MYRFTNLFNTKSHLSCLNTGERCETISECSVPCEHGRCTHKPDVCECETNWGPPGNCSIYEGPCLNCSSEGGTCKDGPNTCKCKPGMNNDTQCPLLLNEILVLFPALTIILLVKKAHEYRRRSSQLKVRFAGKLSPLWSRGARRDGCIRGLKKSNPSHSC